MSEKRQTIELDLEILVFQIDEYVFGINLKKVREIINDTSIRQIPYTNELVDGVFEIRKKIIPLINIKNWLEIRNTKKIEKPKIVICTFMGVTMGFKVDSVERIYKISWNDVHPAERIKRFTNVVMGNVNIQDKLITLLDFENIVYSLDNNLVNNFQPIDTEERKSKHIWILDDSSSARSIIKNLLNNAGYENLTLMNNPLETLSGLEEINKGQNENQCHLIITDLEMPQMNGYEFIHKVRELKQLNQTPIIICSSLIGINDKIMGESLDVVAQIPKNQTEELIKSVDRILLSDNKE